MPASEREPVAVPAPGGGEEDLAGPGRRALDHGAGPLLVLGAAGTGRTELIAQRVAGLAAAGTGPEQVLLLCSTRATADRLRDRVETLLAEPFEELWIGTWEAIGERLLRDYPGDAGLDPFFEVLGPAERLAMLLDRLEDLPLRHHEIRGNPAGLLARLLRRIDALKAEAVSPQALAELARRRQADAGDEAALEAARREREFAELYAAHDRILAEAGSLDSGDVTLALRRLLSERADVRREIAARFRYTMVDELEDATLCRWAVLAELAADNANQLCAMDDDQAAGAASRAASWFRELHPDADVVVLERCLRGGSAVVDASHAVVAPISERLEKPARSAEGSDAEVRFWRARNERAQAQAVAREVEQLLAGGVAAAEVCVIVEEPSRQGGVVGAALEERSVPFHLAGPAALFRRPEVRDAIAWLRLLADPDDSAAAARALTRPPTELRSVDLARLTTIARRRKLDTVSACEAALESPQVQPEARERIQAFLKLYRAASAAMEERRPDVFVRRLIERVGLRRQRLFAAQPEAAERLLSLSRLAELASAWTRREPQGSTRDFVRYLSAVADAGVELGSGSEPPSPGSVQVIALDDAKGREFEHVYVLGLERSAAAERSPGPPAVPPELLAEAPAGSPASARLAQRRRALYVAMTRARSGLVLSWVERDRDGPNRPSRLYEEARTVLGAAEEIQEEELFGPAEGLHATYRMLRDEVLEASWRAGRELSEPRLDTVVDVNRAVVRHLELLKLAALAQRPGSEKTADAIEAINGLLRQVATPEQQAELEASSLDEYLLEEERERGRRRELLAAREEPSLEAFLPRRGEGLRLSASDLDLYLTCPLKYKFARVFGIPQEPTINQRFGILIHGVLERFHKEREHGEEDGERRLLSLFEAGWRRAGFGTSDDELQFRDRAREALKLYWRRERDAEGEPVWLERKFDFQIGPHHVRGRVDRVDRLPGGGYELIDYKTGERRTEAQLADDLQLSLYRLAAREAWQVEAAGGSYYYVLDAEKVAVEGSPDDAERVERTVLEVGEGVMSQDFEPRPSPTVCGWCDYRLICPAAES
ncbi:MAG: ATP-dependent DNA helicase [Solirubrobacterales bacterium]